VGNAKAWHSCDPNVGDTCNSVVLDSSSTINYLFGPAIGVSDGSTGTVQSAACRGTCGLPGSPLDVVMVLDRTSSMTAADLANAKNGALSVLQVYDPAVQWVGLVGLPYDDPTNPCNVNHTQVYPNPGPIWKLVGLSKDYRNPDGTLNQSSPLVSTINCLQRTPNTIQVTPPGVGHTDLGDPVQEAANMLITEGRPDVPDILILLTDGEANQPRYNQPCSYLYDRAVAAQGEKIEVYTIGYGVASARCLQDTAGRYVGKYASTVLADSATDSKDNAPGGCSSTENTDNDHYFCEAGSGDLEPVFLKIADQALGSPKLIDI
jgi:hypothetical protein